MLTNFKNVVNLITREASVWYWTVGKEFRNEITKGNFVFRTLEFEQEKLSISLIRKFQLGNVVQKPGK